MIRRERVEVSAGTTSNERAGDQLKLRGCIARREIQRLAGAAALQIASRADSSDQGTLSIHLDVKLADFVEFRRQLGIDTGSSRTYIEGRDIRLREADANAGNGRPVVTGWADGQWKRGRWGVTAGAIVGGAGAARVDGCAPAGTVRLFSAPNRTNDSAAQSIAARRAKPRM